MDICWGDLCGTTWGGLPGFQGNGLTLMGCAASTRWMDWLMEIRRGSKLKSCWGSLAGVADSFVWISGCWPDL